MSTTVGKEEKSSNRRGDEKEVEHAGREACVTGDPGSSDSFLLPIVVRERSSAPQPDCGSGHTQKAKNSENLKFMIQNLPNIIKRKEQPENELQLSNRGTSDNLTFTAKKSRLLA